MRSLSVRGGVEYEPPAPPERLAEWRRELSLIAPQNEEISWLWLDWVSGDPWETNVCGGAKAAGIGRWLVYQMTPRKRIPALVLEDLEGPNPRVYGRWDAHAVCRECDGWQEQCAVCGGTGRGAYVQSREVAVNRYQWELFRQFGAWAQPLWVVQGSKGGHLRRFSVVQSKLSVMNGGPEQPPAPGDLPYAEPDSRTFAALGAMDNVRKFDLMIDFADRRPEQVEAHEQAAYTSMREQMWSFISGQLEARLKDERPLLRHLKDQMPVAHRSGEQLDPERVRENFIHRP